MKNIDLSNMSAVQLEQLANVALDIANDLRKKEPSYKLAILAGVQDSSYKTVRHGRISRYAGEATITMDDGSLWKALGHGTEGSPEFVTREGYIEFFRLT